MQSIVLSANELIRGRKSDYGRVEAKERLSMLVKLDALFVEHIRTRKLRCALLVLAKAERVLRLGTGKAVDCTILTAISLFSNRMGMLQKINIAMCLNTATSGNKLMENYQMAISFIISTVLKTTTVLKTLLLCLVDRILVLLCLNPSNLASANSKLNLGSFKPRHRREVNKEEPSGEKDSARKRY